MATPSPTATSPLQGIGIRIMALGVVPLLIMVGLSLFAGNRYQAQITTTMAIARTQQAETATLQHHVIAIKDRISSITVLINGLVEQHLTALLGQDASAIKAIETQRADADAVLRKFAAEIEAFETAIKPLGIQARPFASPEEAKSGSPSIRAAGQLALLTSQLKSLPNLLATLAASNQATLKLLGQSKFEDAANNFIYEESARMAAFTQAIKRINTIVADLSDAIGAVREQAIAAELATIGDTVAETASLTQWISGLLALALIAGAVLFATRSLSRPLSALAQTMTALAGGDRSVTVAMVERSDELGDMARAVQVFKDNAEETERLRLQQEQERRQTEEDKRKVAARLADQFEASVRDLVRSVSDAAKQMQAATQTLSSTTEQSSHQSEAAAHAASGASTSVQTVASATEELTASVNEISRQVTESTRISTAAVEEANQTNSTIAGLSEAAQKIGEVVNLIKTIAGQTNLLALNATIEAARAGEAGKGFAVVASEVKNLANQTAKATEDIEAQVSQMQSVTSTAVNAIKSIATIIRRMSEITTTIASAVEEQAATTREISRSIQDVAHSTRSVSDNIGGVSQSAQQTRHMADQALGVAKELNGQAETLGREVNQFVTRIRSS